MRLRVRDGFFVLLAALWCADDSGVLPLVLLAAAIHEMGHIAVLYAAGGRVARLDLTACGAVLHCRLPEGRCGRAAVCLAGPAASFALTALAQAGGAWRLAGASALLGLFNLLPVPPLDGGMALRHLAGGRGAAFLSMLSLLSLLSLSPLSPLNPLNLNLLKRNPRKRNPLRKAACSSARWRRAS